jgi:hypothetical protein
VPCVESSLVSLPLRDERSLEVELLSRAVLLSRPVLLLSRPERELPLDELLLDGLPLDELPLDELPLVACPLR